MKTPYDPKLREAAEEFKAICKKYDCAGFVLFVSPTHSEFVNHFSPSWSVARLEGHGVRFRAKAEELGSAEARNQAVLATTHMFTSAIEWSRQTNEVMRSIVQQLGRHIKIAWSTWDEPDSVPGDGK